MKKKPYGSKIASGFNPFEKKRVKMGSG